MTIRVVGPVAFVLVWWLGVISGILDSALVADPAETGQALVRLLSTQALHRDVLATVWRTVAGLALGASVGLPIGFVMGASRTSRDALDLLLDFWRSVPATALFPLAILLLGIGDAAKIGVVAFAASLLLTIQTMYGVLSASPTRIEAVSAMGASPSGVFRHVLVWEALPYIAAGIRLAASLALVLVVVTEMFLGTTYGLGKVIIDSQSTYRVPDLYAAILVTGMLGYGLNRLIVGVERRVIHWRDVRYAA